MHCAKCGAENRAGARFCDACGVALVEASSESSAPSAAGAIQVRVNLESARAELPDGERKTVTALFADIKGSTELMEDLDPEEARAIVDPALKIMVDAVRRYEGYGAPRRRERRPDGHLKQPCCARDEGRPLEVGGQALASNHRKLQGSRALVVSVAEKAELDSVRCGAGRRA
jgi:class 3 adenylate cyclase